MKIALSSIMGVLAVLAAVLPAAAEEYVLHFVKTQNAPSEASGVMKIKVTNGQSIVHFGVSGAFPNTVYTIWIVFKKLVDPIPTTSCEQMFTALAGTYTAVQMAKCAEVPSSNPSPFHPAANGVSPMARLGSAFTNGMGLDPGAAFATDGNGNGQVQVKLDYELIKGGVPNAPLSNKDVIMQCVPDPRMDSAGRCVDTATPSKKISVTTTWLRKFVGEFPLADRSSTCANYDPQFDKDPENAAQYDETVALQMDARFWQCVAPASERTLASLPRVQWFEWDHFRLANHPDDLTHGFIGGNGIDHWIDMVGKSFDLQLTTNSTAVQTQSDRRR